MVTFREFVSAFRRLGIDRTAPIIAHASLSAFGEVHGGVETVLGAMMACWDTVVMPTFTYKTMLIPESGPADNGILYGTGKDSNALAEFFRPDMPADRLMGAIPEGLRRHPKSRRSSHPILSFAGINAEAAINSQSLAEPLAPIRILTESKGWALLLGVDYSVNTSIHYAEQLAGRKQFVRWALTPRGVAECPGFPGCSDGFPALAPRLEAVTRRVAVGPAQVQAVPLVELVEAGRSWVVQEPLAMLCSRSYCDRCQAVRESVSQQAI